MYSDFKYKTPGELEYDKQAQAIKDELQERIKAIAAGRLTTRTDITHYNMLNNSQRTTNSIYKGQYPNARKKK